jgi:outer membrane protein OmpA-like peptidoglycan-associated protein
MKTAAIAAVITGGGAGMASATEGWYGRIDAGYGFEGELEVQGVGTFDLDDGWMGSGGVGYAFEGPLRLEGELSYRKSDYGASADAEAGAGMLNAYLDLFDEGGVQPYVGAGLGYVHEESTAAGDGNGFAWQVLAGVGLPVNDRLMLDVGYRYFSGPQLDSLPEVEYTHQAATVGLRWQFGAEAPPPPQQVAEPPPPPPSLPPPPPPQACPTTDFVVYFEWDRSNLNQAGLETIDAAVNQARSCNYESVVIVGHTDTSGAAQYNMGLSERRAGVVRDALTARGVAATVIRSEARGETDLARATRDGVREPLNRRTAVTITFRP